MIPVPKSEAAVQVQDKILQQMKNNCEPETKKYNSNYDNDCPYTSCLATVGLYVS